LRVDDLTRIVQAELTRVGGLMERRHGQRYTVAEEIPLAIVMREGAQSDARTVKAQAEVFLKEEIFKACQLFADERVDSALAGIEEVRVEIDEEHAGEVADHLFRDTQRPAVLFVGEAFLGRFYTEAIPQMEWILALNPDQIFDVLTKRAVDFVLLDLAVRPSSSVQYEDLSQAFGDVSKPLSANKTVLDFDYSPLAARRYAVGQQILEQLHARMPEVPVYLFSLENDAIRFTQKGVDEELLIACVRAGGARGVIRTPLGSHEKEDVKGQRDVLCAKLEGIATRLRRERMAGELARQHQVIAFDTAPALDEDEKRLRVRCRNFRLVRAVQSADASALVSDIERPSIRFTEVIGAVGAKTALSFIRDWLREPKK
jgi:hypothetical protein